jgi:hypothetical protein
VASITKQTWKIKTWPPSCGARSNQACRVSLGVACRQESRDVLLPPTACTVGYDPASFQDFEQHSKGTPHSETEMVVEVL